MKILFLHGWQSPPGGLKPTYLKDHGHTVLNPALPDDDFDAAVRIAQAELDQGKPEVVVGSSRGGAVAMNIDAGATPLVLLCPAWKRWGTATTVKPGTIILHSRADETVPFADSEELVKNSGLPPKSLIALGNDHRLADPEPLAAMLRACERAAAGQESSGHCEGVVMRRKPNFVVDADSFRLLREDVGIGRIVELNPSDSSLIAPHIEHHPETIYAACSGVNLTGQHSVFQSGEQELAVEWVRKESKPQPTEPECNAYRYIFGLTSNDECFGYDVTEQKASPTTGQVADHWMTFDDVVNRHFPGE